MRLNRTDRKGSMREKLEPGLTRPIDEAAQRSAWGGLGSSNRSHILVSDVDDSATWRNFQPAYEDSDE